MQRYDKILTKPNKMDKIFTPIKGRFLKYLDYKGISKEKFFTSAGIASSNFKGSGAKSELGGDKLVKILSACDDLNAEWLITGKGKMLKGAENGAYMNASAIKGSVHQVNGNGNQIISSGDQMATEQMMRIEMLTEKNKLLEEKILLLEQTVVDKIKIINLLETKK